MSEDMIFVKLADTGWCDLCGYVVWGSSVTFSFSTDAGLDGELCLEHAEEFCCKLTDALNLAKEATL